jgi:hypothetical protein
MILSTQADADQLLHRFYGFFDALITHVRVDLARQRSDRVAHLRVLAEEGGTGSSDSWHPVDFTITGLSEFRFQDTPRGSDLVLTRGLRIYIDTGRALLDLEPTDGPLEEDDLRSSVRPYMLGRGCSVEVGERVTDF